MKKFLIGFLIVGIIAGGILNALEEDKPSEALEKSVVSTSEIDEEIVVATETFVETVEYGVSESELRELEKCMKTAGWDYDRDDFERIYRLKDDEMTMNPATFAEYEVTIKEGRTHRITLNKSLIE